MLLITRQMARVGRGIQETEHMNRLILTIHEGNHQSFSHPPFLLPSILQQINMFHKILLPLSAKTPLNHILSPRDYSSSYSDQDRDD